MFIGRLGRDRTFVLAPDKSAIRLPSDLNGITTVHYDAERFDRRQRAAVGSACTRITQALKSIQPQVSPEPRSRARLDRAMSRLSKDLEDLLAGHGTARRHADGVSAWPGSISSSLDRRLCTLR